MQQEEHLTCWNEPLQSLSWQWAFRKRKEHMDGNFSHLIDCHCFDKPLYPRHFRKRSTYLVINLTIADLLFGVAAVLSPILEPNILESYNILGEHFNWYAFLYFTLNSLFPAASLANLSLISLERLHATIYPFDTVWYVNKYTLRWLHWAGF